MKLFLRFLAVLLIATLMAPWVVLAEGEETSEEEGSEASSITENKTPEKFYTSGDTGDVIYMCTGGDYDDFALQYSVDLKEDGDTNEETELLKTKISNFEALYSENVGYGTCGTEENDLTGSLEMSDCAKEGKVVTEISESFAGDTILKGENDSVEAQVVTVYRATCCLIVEEIEKTIKVDGNEKTVIAYECKDYRKLYYTDLELCTGKNDWSCERRQWIIGENGASIIKVYVKQIYIWAAGTIGFIAVVVIVLNGIRITMSGVSGDVTQAKERILQSISGLVLLFLSGLILYTINPTFFS